LGIFSSSDGAKVRKKEAFTKDCINGIISGKEPVFVAFPGIDANEKLVHGYPLPNLPGLNPCFA